jgi:hypothetical protein
MQSLPVNLLLEIVGDDLNTARNLIFGLPKFGRSSLKLQEHLKKTIVIRRIRFLNGSRCITYELAGGHLHRLDGPAMIGLSSRYLMWMQNGKRPKEGIERVYEIGDQVLMYYEGERRDEGAREVLDFWYLLEVNSS